MKPTRASQILQGFPSECPPSSLVDTNGDKVLAIRAKSLFEDVCSLIQPSSILEIGSWMGSSSISWKAASEKYRQGAIVYCIDTWLGSPEHYLSTAGNEWNIEKLSITDKGPTFFEEFLRNIHSSGYGKCILPMRADSYSALKYLALQNAMFDIIYIDGAHDEISVFRDVTLAFGLLTEGGVICGDDFGWQSVKTALFLSSFDKATPKFNTLVKDGDFILVNTNNVKVIEFLASKGYSNWNSFAQAYVALRFMAKKLFFGCLKLF